MMENKLKKLRKAMDSTTHKGIHFTDIQKRKIRSSLHQQEINVKRKPNVYMHLITTLAASLFVVLFYTDLLANLNSNNGENQGANQSLEGEWEVRDEYSKNSKVLFSVSPDPNLSAGKPYGYVFSFKEPFETYKGKEIDIYAIYKETGERINVLPSKKITEPSAGYSSLGRFTASLTVPEGGIWKYEVLFDKKLYGDVVLSVGEETIENKLILPNNIPSFVRTSDFEMIDWNKKAVDLGNHILGNKNKAGVIGADMASVNINQKWMWHLWGIENPNVSKLTVVGFHRETETIQQILTTGWTLGLGGENNGADAHTPSSVNLPMAGEWAILLYIDEKLFDVVVYDIQNNGEAVSQTTTPNAAVPAPYVDKGSIVTHITAEEQNMVENSSALSGFVSQENGPGFFFDKVK